MEKRIHNRWTSRPNKRILLIALLVLTFLSLSLLVLTPTVLGGTCRGGRINKSINEAIAFSIDQASFGFKSNQDQAVFVDLNRLEATANAKKSQEKVIILTPLKNAGPYLERYFELVDELNYPKHLISIAFLVSDTTDDTVDILRSYATDRLTRRNRYDSITIFEKDFNFELPEDKRHSFELQPLRRSFMARSRNYLLTAALRDDHAWVLWLDVDVVRYPDTILQDLQSLDVDVVVPNCLRETEDGSFWGYDKNNWQETDESRAVQENLEPNHVLLEGIHQPAGIPFQEHALHSLYTMFNYFNLIGYAEFETRRYAMVDMPTDGNRLEKVPLDGVGATFTLVKANVHREGANFPPYPYEHQVETEGFAKIARAMGFGVYGLPAYLIYHISNS